MKSVTDRVFDRRIKVMFASRIKAIVDVFADTIDQLGPTSAHSLHLVFTRREHVRDVAQQRTDRRRALVQLGRTAVSGRWSTCENRLEEGFS
jgi:hypothetical protein